MKTKLALIALVSAVVIFPAVFFRTPPPSVAGLVRPTIDRTVFDAVEAPGNIRNRLQAKTETGEGGDDDAEAGDEGGGFFSRLTKKGGDENGAGAKATNRPNFRDKSKVVRPRANRPIGGEKSLNPTLRSDRASTKLKKRQDILAKRRAEREQAQDGGETDIPEPAMKEEPPLPEIEIPHEEPLPEELDAPEDPGDEGAVE